MSLAPIVPFLAAALVASVTGMVHGTGTSDADLTAWMAIAFNCAIVVSALIVNVPFWSSKEKQRAFSEGAAMTRRNARLAALVYTWGAAAMFAVYTLSPLRWRHAWQYGLGMALFAIGIAIYVYWSDRAKPPHKLPLQLTIMHFLAAVGGLIYLIGTNKLQTIKSDWAANEVFLWGGIGIAVLCVIAGYSQWLARDARPTSDSSTAA